MTFSLTNRALLRGMLAGAVVLTGTACSRSDRTESGRDNSAAVLPDTTSAQFPGSGTATGAVSDTATTSAQPSISAQPKSPRAETASPGDKDAAGYRSMKRDTTSMSETSAATDTAVVDAAIDAPADVADTSSTEMAGTADTAASTDVSDDTTAAGYVEMARDTSTVADQADTAATPSGDVALQSSVDTTSQGNVDVSAETGIAAADAADIRSPEDSTEILGQDAAADETADEQVVRPEDREAVAASETWTDEVGAAAVGGNVTGAEAVALMSRQGVRCAIVDPEANEAVRWDMSSTPVALNPCGMGSMNPSRIWTER